jgi:Domain of unknown function (DUF4145)
MALDGSSRKQTLRAPCSTCLGETEHNVLHVVDRGSEDVDRLFTLLECAGCKDILLRELSADAGDPENAAIRYYPSPASRKVPGWVHDLAIGQIEESAGSLGNLFIEIYQAVRGGQLRLAIMGVRALIEKVMILKVGDKGSFAKNLDAFQQAGFSSTIQYDQLNEILEAGHAAIHRTYLPTTEEIEKVLDVVEEVMAAIFVHTAAVKKISERVPPRPKRGC